MPLLTLRRSLDAVQVEPLAGPLFARYLTVKDPSLEDPAGPGQIELSAFAALDSPQAIPPVRHASFLRIAARVSTAVQGALRAWLPLLWFSRPSGFDDFDTAAALLIYASCRTYTPRDRSSFTFDVLDSDTPRAVLYSATRNLPARLTATHRMLAAIGYPKANLYRPIHVDRVLASYRRKPHPLHSLFVAERDLIEAYVTQGEWPSDEEKRMEADTAISRRLRKVCFGMDAAELRPVLDEEARLGTVRLLANWCAKNAVEVTPEGHEESFGADGPTPVLG